MIFLDANLFLRALTEPAGPTVARMHYQAADLFRQAERGEVEVTTSEAVIAKVAYVLTAKAHYQLSVPEAVGRLAALLRVRGVRLHDKRVVLQALDLWSAYPRLGFVDALAASYARQPGIELATFDRDFDQIPGLRRWQPLQ